MSYVEVYQSWEVLTHAARPPTTGGGGSAAAPAQQRATFAEMLQVRRLERRWPVHELARRVGLEPSLVSRLERGDEEPTAAVAASLDAALLAKGECSNS